MTMDKDEIYERVCEVVSDVLGVNVQDITADSSFVEDLGAESIQSLELVAAFEEEFDIEMDEEVALQVQTVGAAVDFIADVLEKQSGQ
jgi:acyl carrier protein